VVESTRACAVACAADPSPERAGRAAGLGSVAAGLGSVAAGLGRPGGRAPVTALAAVVSRLAAS